MKELLCRNGTMCIQIYLKSFRNRYCQLLFLILLSTFAVSYHLPSHAATISGRVSLPGGDVAPAEGLQIFYQAKDLQPVNPELFQSTFLTILAGASFVDFTLTVPDNATAQWQVKYTCGFSAACVNYVQIGYYDTDTPTTTTSYKESEADTVPQNSASVNMTVLNGTRFSGTATIPDGNAPAGGFDYEIRIIDAPTDIAFEIETFTITEGNNSGAFTLTAPNDAALTYHVGYNCTSNNHTFCFNNYVRTGFFDSDVAGGTVETFGEAEVLAGDTSRTDVNMTFLTGSTISGEISLPSGTAPAGGISIQVSASDINQSSLPALTNITINQGSDSEIYSINAPNDNGADWRISYFCNSIATPVGCLPYFGYGFFDADTPVTTTTDNFNQADLLAGGQNYSDIGMTLLTTTSISGTVTLDLSDDPNLIAPAGGLDVTVFATNTSGGGVSEQVDVHIAEGNISTPYSINLPDVATNNWEIYYFCSEPASGDPCAKFSPVGYYDMDAPGTTTTDISQADTLTGGVNHTNIVMTLFQITTELLCFPIVSKNGGTALICL